MLYRTEVPGTLRKFFQLGSGLMATAGGGLGTGGLGLSLLSKPNILTELEDIGILQAPTSHS